ncbi:MAG TPA: endonuclease/exonuclease/phosphatase family protein [Gemmatimonadaceae bacterium]|nr:endonuclease/exonuclease/phosphatase family protein [Gemmatimonadaceae bacterium]
MATFTIRCECGEQYHVDSSAIGRRIACRRCRQLVDVVAPGEPENPAPKVRRRRRSARQRDGASATTAPRQPVVIPRRGLARLLAVAVWGYLGVLAAVALIMWVWGDVTIVGSVLLFMGRWIVLLPLALLLPAALWLRRDLLLPLAAATLVALGPVMGFRTGWRRLLPAPDGPSIRVLSYNAGGGAVIAQLLPDFLTRWQPQIVAFQECGEPLVAALRRVTGWHQHVSRDLCVLSRYPIRAAAVMDRSALDRVKQSEENEIGGAGYVVRFVLDGPRGPIRVGNLHLETPRKGFEGLMERDVRRLRMNTEIRDVESHLARQWIDSGAGPLVVLGDFNTPVESRIMRRHWGHLTNAFSAAGAGFGTTKHNGWIRVRIDHVLASDDWHVERVQLGRETYSDHRPVVVDLRLRR